MSVRSTPDGRYFVQYRVPGRIAAVKEYFGRGPEGKRAADIRDKEIQLARARGFRVAAPTGIYLDALAQAYIGFCKAEGRSLRWMKELANLLNNHILPILSNRPVEQLEFTDILKVLQHYEDRSQSTKNRYCDYLRAIFRFGVDHGLTTNNPMKAWKKKKEPRRSVKLTVDDLRRIYEHAEYHLQWAIECEWNLGTRPGVSELLTIKWSDIDFDNNTIHIKGTKTLTSDRLVHINMEFRSRLLEMKDKAKTEYLIEYKGKPVKKFRRSFKTACAGAGITYDCTVIVFT